MAGMGDRGIMISGGTLNLHGDRTHTWTKLSNTAQAGSTSIEVLDASGWRVGDEIVGVFKANQRGFGFVIPEQTVVDVPARDWLPDVRDRMQVDGMLPVGGTSAQFGAFLRDEIRKWQRIIQQAGISPG